MSILKHTSFQILSATMAGQGEHTFQKVAHKADFSHIEREPGFLYVRSRAISSRINENFDGFSADEIEKGYKTFLGKPVFVSHHNSNHRRARGAIVDVALHKDALADGSPDTWVEVLMMVDAVNFPKLAQGILAGEIARTSMGCDVAYSSCTFCGNKAYTEAEYCSHIPRLKGKRIRRVDAKTGSSEMVLVAEQCYGLNFFENSLLVEEPADPTAYVLGVDGVGVTASKVAEYVPTCGAIVSRDPFVYCGKPATVTLVAYPSGAEEADTCDDPSHIAQYEKDGFRVETGNWDRYASSSRRSKTAVDYDVYPRLDAQGDPIGSSDRLMELARQYQDKFPWPPTDEQIYESFDYAERRIQEEQASRYSSKTADNSNPNNTDDDDFIITADDITDTWPTQKTTSKTAGLCERCDTYEAEPTMDLCSHCLADDFSDYRQKVMSEDDDLKEAKKARSFRGQRVAKLHKLALNETIAPPEVDTLRESECPICGSDAYNGEECPVCMFIKPPDMFMDPDTDAAQNADLRQDEDQAALDVSQEVMQDQGQTPIGDDLADAGVNLECDTCGAQMNGGPQVAQADTSQPALPGNQAPSNPTSPQPPGQQPPAGKPTPPTAQPTQPSTQNGSEPPPPANDESAPLPTGPADDKDVPPAGNELPKPKDGENDQGQDDGSKKAPQPQDDTTGKDVGKVQTDVKPGGESKNDSSKDSSPSADDGTKPKNNADGTSKDDTKAPTEDQAVDTLQTDLKPGDECPVCDGQGTLQEKKDEDESDDSDDSDSAKDQDDSSDDSDDDKKDDDKKSDGPPWQNGKNSSKGVKSSIHQRHSGVHDMAQPTVKVLASQQAEIRRLKAENAQLRRSVNYIAQQVGIAPRRADVNDPGEPVPQPAGGAPAYTTEEAMTPAARVNVWDIGATPVNEVGADGEWAVDSIGGVQADTPYQVNQEVTTPVAGTTERRPVDEVRTLPEIQFGNPLVPNTAFPLQGEFAARPTLSAKGRAFAAIRLARLRRAAGIETSGRDELVVANAIDTDRSLSNEAIKLEIDTLSRVVSAKQAPAPRQASRRLVPQSADGVGRTIPSVAVDQGLTSFTASSASDDDAFAFCD